MTLINLNIAAGLKLGCTARSIHAEILTEKPSLSLRHCPSSSSYDVGLPLWLLSTCFYTAAPGVLNHPNLVQMCSSDFAQPTLTLTDMRTSQPIRQAIQINARCYTSQLMQLLSLLSIISAMYLRFNLTLNE